MQKWYIYLRGTFIVLQYIIWCYRVKLFCPCEQFIICKGWRKQRAVCDIGYGVSEAFVYFLLQILFWRMIYVTLRYTSLRKLRTRKTIRRYHTVNRVKLKITWFSYSSFSCTTSTNIDGCKPSIRKYKINRLAIYFLCRMFIPIHYIFLQSHL